MKYIIQDEVSMQVFPCTCGSYPKFVFPNPHHTDCWLECECGKRTSNTGGYYYASEIPINAAKKRAIEEWNNKYGFCISVEVDDPGLVKKIYSNKKGYFTDVTTYVKKKNKLDKIKSFIEAIIDWVEIRLIELFTR